MEENLIKALSSLTGIRESKLRQLETDFIYDIINKPNIIEPTKNQLEKLNILSELVTNLGIAEEFKYKNQIDFSNSYEAGKYFKHLIGSKKDKEVFLMAMFDKNNSLIKIKKISEGTINSASIYPRDILKEALSTKCKSVIFCHNHPSGDTTPSPEDVNLTNKYINIFEPLKINIKDHIIVGDNIYSFLENDLLEYDKKTQSRVAEQDISNYVSKDYYEKHLNKYLNALSSLTGIKKEKLYTFIEEEKGNEDNQLWHHKALKILEKPSLTASKLGLSSSERKKLKNLNLIFNSSRSYTTKNISSVRDPSHLNAYVRVYLSNEKLDNDNLYIMLFNNKSRVIGFEKLSYTNGNELMYNPKDILQKSLDYEAIGISIIMTSKKGDINFRNNNIDELKNISKNAVNILLPIEIKVIDSLYLDEKEYISLKDKGIFPYTNFGQPEYKKTKIFDYDMEKDIQDNQLYKYEFEDEFEDEDEWELDF